MGNNVNVSINAPGSTVLETGTTAITAADVNTPIVAINIIADAVFTTLTGMTGDALAGVTFAAGTWIYGKFTAVTLASGKAVLYT